MITQRDCVFTVVFMLLMAYALGGDLRLIDRWIFGIGILILGVCELRGSFLTGKR